MNLPLLSRGPSLGTLSAWLLTVMAGLSALGAAAVHVSPSGDDSAAGTAAAPVRSVAVGLAKARGSGPGATVVLTEGRHELGATLELGVEDSGVTLTAAPGARAVLSGGVRVVGWERDAARPGLWRVTLPGVREGSWTFRQLFVDGRRAIRARTPNEGFFRATGRLGTNSPIALPFRAGDLRASWAALPDARVVMLMKWTDLHVPIRGVDEARGEALLAGGPRPYWMDERDARYWVENVPEALDAPDEWYLDRTTGVLSYLAPEGVDPNRSVVVAPRLITLLRVRGDAASRKAVSGVTLRRLVLAETDHEMPADGLISPQAAVPIRGAVQGQHAVDVHVDGCRFENLGGYGLDLGAGAQRWVVERSEMWGLGAGGVRIGEPDGRDPDAFTACRDHVLVDNHLHGLGRIFAPAVGVLVFQSGGNRIAHNEINDLYYTAISVGWNWGYQETPCRENLIEFNHLHHIGQGRLSDMGGVYTLGIQPGTVVRNNLIHDIVSYDYGGWGLYTDEGSTGILLENNVVYGCKSSGFHQHYGRENTIRNNIFAFNLENQLMRTRDEQHLSFWFTNNIVVYDTGRLLGSSWKNDRFVIDGNLYFDLRAGADVSRMEVAGGTWEQWKARGHDTRSLVADPLFVDAAQRNFRLQPQSPAVVRLGFQPIDIRSVGPRQGRGGR